MKKKKKTSRKKTPSPGDKGYIDWVNKTNKVSNKSKEVSGKDWDMGTIFAGIIVAIIGVVIAAHGDMEKVFSGKGLILFIVAAILIPIGFIWNNKDYDDEQRQKRIDAHNKEARERDKAKEQGRSVSSENAGASKEGSSGTAFFVDNKGHVVTNAHVIAGFENKAKILYDNEEVKLKFIAKDEQLDLALLKASVKNENYVEIADKNLKKMQNIVAAGYPLGKHLSDDLKFTSGIISSLKGPGNNSAIIQIDAALNPGNSGGPIVDKENGNLAGVAVAGLRKDVFESINYGIKSSRVKDFLESNRITLKSNSDKSKKKDVSDILEDATVYIFCN